MQAEPVPGVPERRIPTFAIFPEALRRGVRDFLRAPVYGLVVGGAAVVGGLAFAAITRATGQSYWLVFAAIGFPLIGPFLAVALYEVSRRLEAGLPLSPRAVFGVVFDQRHRQLPSVCAVVVVFFLFWFFLAHMIFALFLGRMSMVNVSTGWDVYLTQQGLTMLVVGTVVGGILAGFLYAVAVLSLPMLLDREVDYVSAMIASFQTVAARPVLMLAWGAFLAVAVLISMLPWFLGLLVVLPVLGHATWHVYDQLRIDSEEARAE